MIKLIINEKEIELKHPITILEAAKTAGIKIPTLCYYKGLEPFGGCRLCLVEIERVPRLQTSCTVRVTDGMVVRTETERIAKARKAMLEFLLINHPLDCPLCDKAGECALQDLTAQYGAHEGRFLEGKRKHPESFHDPIIVRNMERCITCTRCVRMCDDMQGAYAITVTGRGSESFVEPFSGGKYNCEYCGNCLTVCPVGAIMSKLHRHSYRPWYVEKEADTICGFCGVGCSMTIQMRAGSVLRTNPNYDLGFNKGMLCVRGRFGYDYLDSQERLKTPLIRIKDKLEPTTWDEALDYAAKKFSEIKSKYTASAIGAIASGRCTNEDNYMLQKFIRFIIGSNNIDSTARFYYASAQKYLERIFGQGITANLISGISNSDGVIVCGGDPTAINPILGVHIRMSKKRYSKIVVIGQPGGLKGFVEEEIIPAPYKEEIVLTYIIDKLLKGRSFSGENAFIESKIKKLKACSHDDLKEAGIVIEEIDRACDGIAKMRTPVVIIGPDIIQTKGASKNLFLLASIVYLINARIFLLCEKPNYQGLIDMGCTPDSVPGGRPLEFELIGHKIKDLIGATAPKEKGLNIYEMIESAKSGKLKSLYVMGENLLYNMPDNISTNEAVNNLEFLVVQDIFLTETAKKADLVLPAKAWSEKSGIYTNLERRMQRLRSGTIASVGRDDWKIIAEIAKRMGMKEKYSDTKDVWEEVISISTLHKGSKYDSIVSSAGCWPYKGEPLREIKEDFEVNNIEDNIDSRKSGETYLMLERPLFHSGTLSRRSKALLSIYPEPYVKVNGEYAKENGLKDGMLVTVETKKGKVNLPLKIDNDLVYGTALLSNTFENTGFMGLVGYCADSVVGSLIIENNSVKIEKSKE
ncbi:NADH:ubiquinone oxidoreductase, subunit G [Candidatus Magnetoovum chiemensis]|nr:NADH:ubiquinone oxidoreductase, subunit G [Candidatus Magnetoovum chiemensis]